MTQESLRAPSPVATAPVGLVSGARQWLDKWVVRRLRLYGLAVLVDIVIVTASCEMATALRFVGTPSFELEMRSLLVPSLLIGLIYATVSYLFGLHRRLWRYASLRDGFALMRAVAVAAVLVAGFDLAARAYDAVAAIPAPIENVLLVLESLPLSVVIGGALLSFLFLGCYKMLPRVIHASRMANAKGDRGRVLIVGAGLAGATLAARLLVNGTGAFAGGYQIAGFVDDDPAKWARRLHGKMVFGPIGQIPSIVRREKIDMIILALPSAGPKRTSEIIAICQQTTASVKILPSLREVVGQVPGAVRLRDINVADLLGREVVPLHTPEAHEALTGKTVLVTGAAGSIGSELCRQLVTYAPATVIALDNNETGLFDLAESLRNHPEGDRIRLQIGDITNARSMERLFDRERPHVIFHAAAYKHVPLLEQHPDQAIRTNVLATHSLCHLARQYDVGCFCFISSDKAADPVNVLGASKRAGEIIVQAMAHEDKGDTRFCAVRFGNVIGSRGSVVPLFTQQIEQGGPVTITDAKATRYFMTIPEACGLVIVTSTIADSGGLFILDMGEPVGIADLAVKMITLRGLRVGQDIPVVYTGLRPGERMHEILAAPGEDLLPTSHSKIRHVGMNGGTPTLYALANTMRTLEDCVESEDLSAQRGRLFEAIHGETAIPTGAVSA